MSEVTKINVDGYPFDVYPITSIDSKFEGCKCVYIYSKSSLNSRNFEHLYVGQTENLARRFREHETGENDSDKCIQQSGATHILVNTFEDESKRLAVEHEILTSSPLGFRCNMQRRN